MRIALQLGVSLFFFLRCQQFLFRAKPVFCVVTVLVAAFSPEAVGERRDLLTWYGPDFRHVGGGLPLRRDRLQGRCRSACLFPGGWFLRRLCHQMFSPLKSGPTNWPCFQVTSESTLDKVPSSECVPFR